MSNKMGAFVMNPRNVILLFLLLSLSETRTWGSGNAKSACIPELKSTAAYRERLGDWPNFNGDDFNNLSQKYTNLDDLLQNLPQQLNEQWTPVFNSNSPHSGEIDAAHGRPRIIRYSGNLTIAYTAPGNREQETQPYPPSETMETIEFKQNPPRQVLKLVQMPGKNYPNLKPKISEENPQNCLSCHRDPPRMIFDPYNSWRATGTTGKGADQVVKTGSQAEKNFKQFYAVAGSDPRYKNLSWGWKTTPAFEQDPSGVTKIYYGQSSSKGRRDNGATIAELALLQNGQIIAGKFLESDYFNQFKFALMGANFQCDDFEGFFPEKFKKTAASLNTVRSEFSAGATKEYQERNKFVFGDNAINPISGEYAPENFSSDGVDDQYVSSLKYVADRFAIKSDHWSPADGQYYSFTSPGRAGQNGVSGMMNESLFGLFYGTKPECQDKDFPPLPGKISTLLNPYDMDKNAKKTYCDALRKKSLAALNTIKNAEACQSQNQLQDFVNQANRYSAGNLFMKCQGCHTGENPPGPHFNFDDLVKLSDDLENDPSLRKKLLAAVDKNANFPVKMPRGDEDLFPQERTAIQDFLASMEPYPEMKVEQNYPNPMVTQTTINFVPPKKDMPLNFQLTDMNGRVVYRKVLESGTNQIVVTPDLFQAGSGVPAGRMIYTLSTSDGKKQVSNSLIYTK